MSGGGISGAGTCLCFLKAGVRGLAGAAVCACGSVFLHMPRVTQVAAIQLCKVERLSLGTVTMQGRRCYTGAEWRYVARERSSQPKHRPSACGVPMGPVCWVNNSRVGPKGLYRSKGLGLVMSWVKYLPWVCTHTVHDMHHLELWWQSCFGARACRFAKYCKAMWTECRSVFAATCHVLPVSSLQHALYTM
jgi:hypothetical protein